MISPVIGVVTVEHAQIKEASIPRAISAQCVADLGADHALRFLTEVKGEDRVQGCDGGTSEVIEQDSGAVARPNPDARTGESPNRPYLAASWFAL
ncbi:MAG TPA: hypothetical protein VLT34_10955, partial [Arthrobacter sp.]|nr:hypothetical protein [Arthrobacter sp.]